MLLTGTWHELKILVDSHKKMLLGLGFENGFVASHTNSYFALMFKPSQILALLHMESPSPYPFPMKLIFYLFILVLQSTRWYLILSFRNLLFKS